MNHLLLFENFNQEKTWIDFYRENPNNYLPKTITWIRNSFFDKIDSYSYELKSDENKSEKFGFIAQDLIKAGFSNLVGFYEDENSKEYIDSDGLKSPEGVTLTVNYEQIIPILFTTIKDLKSQVDELKKIICEQRFTVNS